LGSLFGMEEPHARLEREGKLSPEQARIPNFGELLQQKSGYSPEELKPRGGVENFVQRFGSQAPFAALLGGPAALASTAIGSGVASGAGVLGAPEGLQDLLQLGTELTHGYVKGRIPAASTKQNEAYTAAKSLAGEATSGIEPIQNALNEATKKLGKETTRSVSKEVSHALGVVENNLNQLTKQLKVTDAIDLRRKLNETYRSVSKNAKPYINDVTKSINDFFSIYGAQHPKFFDKLNEADKLTSMIHMETVVDKFANFLADKFPGITGAGGKAVVNVLGIPTVGFIEKTGKNLLKNSAARRHYFDVVKAATTQNAPLFINSIKKLSSSLG